MPRVTSWHILYIANNIIFVAEPHCHADTAMKSQLKINEAINFKFEAIN